MPQTGMAVAIDIGEAGDIHPKNKQDVGRRLARWALRRHVRPGDRGVRPALRLLRRSRAAPMRVRFRHAAGLDERTARPPKGFAIAGADRRWRWAEARIDGETVVVSSPDGAAARGRPLRLGRQPGGDAAQRRGPAGLALPHRRLADAHRPARRAHLPQPGDPGLPPRPERRARGRRLLPRHEQLRVLPRRADLHEPRPRALATAGPRPDAREPAAAAEGPALGRHLRADAPPPRRHVLHDHDERGRRRELLRHREGPGRPVVRARLAAATSAGSTRRSSSTTTGRRT